MRLRILKVTYCHLVWGTTTFTNISKLHKLQNKVVRTIANATFDSHTLPLFNSLGLVRATDLYHTTLRCQYEASRKHKNPFFDDIACLTRRISPYAVRHHEPWNLPRCRTNYGYQMLRFRIPQLLNSLYLDLD